MRIERNNDPNITVPLIVKIPHPASYLSSRDRYLENTFRIIKAFEESGVIDEDFANKKMLEAYDRININE